MTARIATLTLFCLILCLSLCGCSTPKPQVVTVTQVVAVLPPSPLYQPKPLPEPPQVMTPRSHAQWTAKLLRWGNEMIEDREAIRRFVESREGETNGQHRGAD